MADMTRFITFSVEQKDEGKYLRNKILLIAMYIVAAIGIVVGLTAWMKGIGVLIGVILGGVIVLKVLKPLTWKYAKVDHRYEMQSGNWMFYLDYSERSIDYFYKRKIKEAEAIVPMTEENIEKYVTGKTFGKEYDMRGSVKAEDAYIVLFPEEDGTKTLIKFVATNDALAVMKFYNAAATEVTHVYH